MAFSADLRRDLSFLAGCERGLYVGRCWGFRGTVSEPCCCFELCDNWDGDDDDDDELMKNSSETLELLDDRCIFRFFSFLSSGSD